MTERQCGKEPACHCRRRKRCGFDPWVKKMPWRRAWQPTPVFLPGESNGQRSLVGYSPWGHKELDTTERLHFHFHIIAHMYYFDIANYITSKFSDVKNKIQLSKF